MTSLLVKLAFVAVALSLGLLGFLKPRKRTAMWIAAGAFAFAGLAVHFAAFWPCVWCSALGLVCIMTSFDFIDVGWRLRAGIVAAVSGVSVLALWPSAAAFSGGKIPCPSWVREGVGFELVAGLDLRGGLRLTYGVEVDEAIRDKRDRDYESMRSELTRLFGLHTGDDLPSEAALAKLQEKVQIEAPLAAADTIRLSVRDLADVDKVDARFFERFGGDLTHAVTSPGHFEFRVKSSIRSELRDRAVGQAREIIHRRVDELGLREASVSTRDEDLIVEVPGESEASAAQIRDIIGRTARLEFKLVDVEHDMFDELSRNPPNNLPEGLDFQRETISAGLDENGNLKRHNSTFVTINKGEKETNKAALARLQAWTNTLEAPQDSEIAYETTYDTNPETLKRSEKGWRTHLLKRRADITGDLIRDAVAQPEAGQGTLGGWHVGIQFTDTGGRIFERITGENVKRPFAIILDGRVESTPVIQDRIAGGSARITLGSSDLETQLAEARALELVLRSGALPASITPINEQHIGPTLGRDAIQRAVQSALLGSFLVLSFMLIYYRRSGLIANLVVLLNLALQLAILASLGASMTLPGICGLALTIGMSVDSNVLINERLRDEIRAGKAPRSAIAVGFNRALSAIIDGHVTTLISGMVLFQFGTGPIKGFASALLVGMAANLFTGVVVSRVLFDYWVRGRKPAKLDVGALEFFPVGKTLNFMGKRRPFFALSWLTVAATVVLAFIPGPVYGTDFKGGTEVELDLARMVEPAAIRDALEKAGFRDPEVVRVEEGSAHRFLIRTHQVATLDDTTRAAIQHALCFGEGLEESSCAGVPRPSELKIGRGGDKISLRYETAPDLQWIAQRMETVSGIALRSGDHNPVLQDATLNKVEVQLKGKGDQIRDALEAALGPEVVPKTLLRSEWVGPKAGAQLRASALQSIAVAFILIMIYIAFRFDLRFAPGAVVAVAHDAVVTVGVLLALGKEIDLTIVAAVLTVVGYSTNDKVVIYDRIRENLGKLRGTDFTRLINISLSETLSRTIITGGPTILSLLAFFFWGTGALKDFALTLIVGTIVGTYSSMYIAVPFTRWLDQRFFAKSSRVKGVATPRETASV